jgi:hypothetical protein
MALVQVIGKRMEISLVNGYMLSSGVPTIGNKKRSFLFYFI